MNDRGIRHRTYYCQNPNCLKEFGFRGYSSNHKYCSIKCAMEHQQLNANKKWETRYQLWLNGIDLDIKNPRKLIRSFLIKRDGYRCSCCGIENWNGKDITLWTDHIDGNALNNHQSNFRLICPNCDSQSNTFGGKNYGKGRKSRGLPQYG